MKFYTYRYIYKAYNWYRRFEPVSRIVISKTSWNWLLDDFNKAGLKGLSGLTFYTTEHNEEYHRATLCGVPIEVDENLYDFEVVCYKEKKKSAE